MAHMCDIRHSRVPVAMLRYPRRMLGDAPAGHLTDPESAPVDRAAARPPGAGATGGVAPSAGMVERCMMEGGIAGRLAPRVRGSGEFWPAEDG